MRIPIGFAAEVSGPRCTSDRRPPWPSTRTRSLRTPPRRWSDWAGCPCVSCRWTACCRRWPSWSKSVMPGNPETSVLLLVKDQPSTVVSTGQLAVALDERQYERGHGPCLHAARTGELTEIADTRTDRRWPDYLPRAVEAGNLSSLSVPLAIDQDEQVTGALNIYARQPDAFDENSRSVATRFGPYAAVATGNLYAYQSARDMADNLQTALESRAVIDQAKGVLIERYKLTP